MTSLAESTWDDITALRTATAKLKSAATVQAAAQGFAQLFTKAYTTVVLARVFVVVPAARLPARDHDVARQVAGDRGGLQPTTPVLSLLGTSGREAAWHSRARSRGHLAIPLIDRTFVSGAPMIAKLLADLEVDLATLDSGLPIATRRMLGGSNGTFYVPDAVTAVDDAGRHIIPAREFVTRHGVRSVFGMGGSYLDGTLAVAILFTRELLDRVVVERFPSFISTFKTATVQLQAAGSIY